MWRLRRHGDRMRAAGPTGLAALGVDDKKKKIKDKE